MVSYFRHLFWLIGSTFICAVTFDRGGVSDGIAFLKLHIKKPTTCVSETNITISVLLVELLGFALVVAPFYILYKLTV